MTTLPQSVIDFTDFLNEPPQYEDLRMVRDYRHEACSRWLKVLADIQALSSVPEPVGYAVWINGKLAGCAKSHRGAFPVYVSQPTPPAAPVKGEGVRTKPLEWVEDSDDGRPMYRARTDIGPAYTVYDDGFSEPPHLLLLHHFTLGKFETVDEAKQAAQTDFSKRMGEHYA